MSQMSKLSLFILFIFSTFLLYAQDSIHYENSGMEKLKIFVEGDYFDDAYLREEINFADFVNDPLMSDVHIIVVGEVTGSGGHNYSVRFHGKNFKQIENYTLNVSVLPEETDFNSRLLITNTIIRGLMPFFNETASSSKYKINLERVEDNDTEESLDDKWNYWVFKLTSSGGLDYEDTKSGYHYSVYFKGDKVTDQLKINNYIYIENQQTNYKDIGYKYLYNYKYGFNKTVFSLSDHWSTGFTAFAFQSSYYNTKASAAVMGAVEYNFFPWNESNKHILTLAYTVGYESKWFYERNYNLEMSTQSPLHRMYLTVSTIQPWGSAEVSVTGSEYLQNLSLYNVSVDADLSFRLTKGLSLTLNMSAVSIHDQIYLPESAYSVEQIVSGALKLPSTYEFSTSIGLSYQFGSIYNNIVNRRL